MNSYYCNPTPSIQGPKITSYVKVNCDDTHVMMYITKYTEAEWLEKHTYVPKPGEPCLTLDGQFAHQIKFGDGVKTWGELPYAGFMKIEGDGKFITFTDGLISLAGSDNAEAGQTFKIAADGDSIVWFVPAEKTEIVNIENAFNEYKISNDEQVSKAQKDGDNALRAIMIAQSDINDLRFYVDDELKEIEINYANSDQALSDLISQKSQVQIITWEADD